MNYMSQLQLQTIHVDDVYEFSCPATWNFHRTDKNYRVTFFPADGQRFWLRGGTYGAFPIGKIGILTGMPRDDRPAKIFEELLQHDAQQYTRYEFLEKGTLDIASGQTAYYSIFKWQDRTVPLHSMCAWVFNGWNIYPISFDALQNSGAAIPIYHTAEASLPLPQNTFEILEEVFMRTIQSLTIKRQSLREA